MGRLSGVACVLWCDDALVGGRSQGRSDSKDSRVARMPTKAHPTNMLAGTPIIAMRLLEDGALKFLTWVTRHPGCRSGPPAHFSQASAILGPLPG
jgi:hypothetical protein